MSRQRALIVDDEPDIRELLEITLGRMKLDTRSARNVKEARDWLAREPFDLCLTELLDGGHRFLVEVGSDRGADLLDATVAHHGDAVPQAHGLVEVVGDEQDRLAELALQVDDDQHAP